MPLNPWRSAAFHRRCCQSAAAPPFLSRTDRAIDMLADYSPSAAAAAAAFFPRRRNLLGCFLLLLLFLSLYWLILYGAKIESSLEASGSSRYSEKYRLEKVLKVAAMKDRTVILTTLNEAWAAPNSILDLFLESFRIGDGTRRLLKHLVIIALDKKAFLRCVAVHTYCVALTTEGVDFSAEAYFMTSDYLKMMWRRIDFLRAILEMGYNFIFTDADILWFRNPFPRFFEDADFQIACDHFLGDPYDIQNRPNGGFNFVKSNNRTIQFYKFWYSSQATYPGYHDQDVLNFIKFDPFITDIGLKMRFLDTKYFGGLCEPSKDLNQVCTMHANCCFGLDSKLNDLRMMLEDWKDFTSLTPRLKRSLDLSWRVPDKCSLEALIQYGLPVNNVQWYGSPANNVQWYGSPVINVR